MHLAHVTETSNHRVLGTILGGEFCAQDEEKNEQAVDEVDDHEAEANFADGAGFLIAIGRESVVSDVGLRSGVIGEWRGRCGGRLLLGGTRERLRASGWHVERNQGEQQGYENLRGFFHWYGHLFSVQRELDARFGFVALQYGVGTATAQGLP